MNRVQELMVQSQASPVRASCSSALLQFLLDYPLGEALGKGAAVCGGVHGYVHFTCCVLLT